MDGYIGKIKMVIRSISTETNEKIMKYGSNKTLLLQLNCRFTCVNSKIIASKLYMEKTLFLKFIATIIVSSWQRQPEKLYTIATIIVE